MVQQTPKYSLPYVEPSDTVTTYPVVSAELANDVSAALDTKADKAGDTFTGQVNVTHPTQDAIARLDPVSGKAGILEFASAGVRRWSVFRESAAGGNLRIARYDAAAAYQGNAAVIDATTGLISVAGPPTAGTGVATKDYVDTQHRGVRYTLTVPTPAAGGWVTLGTPTVTDTWGATLGAVSGSGYQVNGAGMYRATVQAQFNMAGDSWVQQFTHIFKITGASMVIGLSGLWQQATNTLRLQWRLDGPGAVHGATPPERTWTPTAYNATVTIEFVA